MKLAIYYTWLFIIAVILYLTADKARKNKKKIIEYICYIGIFAEVIILI